MITFRILLVHTDITKLEFFFAEPTEFYWVFV